MPCHVPEEGRCVLAHGGMVTPMSMEAATDPSVNIYSSIDVKPPL